MINKGAEKKDGDYCLEQPLVYRNGERMFKRALDSVMLFLQADPCCPWHPKPTTQAKTAGGPQQMETGSLGLEKKRAVDAFGNRRLDDERVRKIQKSSRNVSAFDGLVVELCYYLHESSRSFSTRDSSLVVGIMQWMSWQARTSFRHGINGRSRHRYH